MIKPIFALLQLPVIISVVSSGCGRGLAIGATTSSSAPPFGTSKSNRQHASIGKGNRRHHHHKSLILQSSNAMRKTYTQPPHDGRLYDILQVKPNATLVEIQRSWRRLSREWHPDKVAVRRRKRRRANAKGVTSQQRSASSDTITAPPPPPPPSAHDNQNRYDNDKPIHEDGENTDEEEDEYARQKLEELTKAYEILSEDHTRLLYHKYGIVGGTDAAIQLLTGQGIGTEDSYDAFGNIQQSSTTVTTEEQGRLLELMGYPSGGYSKGPSPWSLPQDTYQNHHHRSHHHSSHRDHEHRQRLAYLTATITERLRPLVEGTVSQDLFVNDIHQECNSLKKSPLGAHILRCIGRAYRIEGYRALRTMHSHSNGSMTIRDAAFVRRRRRKNAPHHDVTDRVFDGLRGAKHYASAALASGKLVMMEQKIRKLEEDHARQKREKEEEMHRRRREQMDAERNMIKQIECSQVGSEQSGTHFASNIGALPGDEDDMDYNVDNEYGGFNIGALSDDEEEDFLHSLNDDVNNDESFSNCQDEDDLEQELQHLQHQKAYSALLSAHQMEALWKITKIELDRTIREACRWILEPVDIGDGGWYAFCPSEQSPYREEWQHASQPPPPPPPPHSHHRQRHHHHRRHNQRPDGWVGTTGEVVSMEVGRLRAAAAMVLIGDIMVQCSKEGTGWNK